MIKNECDIIKDLLPNYVENQINDNTKEFVEKHIKNCNKCDEMLKMLKGEQTEEETRNKIENIEINYLKKYNKKIKVFKWIAIALGLISIIICTIVLGTNVYEIIENNKAYEKSYKTYEEKENNKTYEESYRTYEEVNNIMNIAYEKTKALFENDNFILKKEFKLKNQSDASHITMYYKDGKYKEVHNTYNIYGNNEIENYTNYGVKSKVNCICLQFTDNKKYVGGLFIMDSKYLYEDHIKFLHLSSVIEQYYNYEIREEEECYVIRRNANYGNSYTEQWINKQSMLLVKEFIYYETYEKLTNYIYEIGTATDEDVMLNKEQTEKVYADPYISNSIERIKPILAY